MSQQTTVEAVAKKFPMFIKIYPDFKSFKKSSEKELLTYWSGLGYYRRAKNLWKTVKIINTKYESNIPSDTESLLSLPGIGVYTASAIRCIGFNLPDTPVDINISRLITGLYGKKLTQKEIILILKGLWPLKKSRVFTEALMDLSTAIRKSQSLEINDLKLNIFLFSKNQKNFFQIKKKNVEKKIIVIDFYLFRFGREVAFLKKANLNFYNGFEHLPNSHDKSSKKIFNKKKFLKLKEMKYTITNHNFEIMVYEIVFIKKDSYFKWIKLNKIDQIPLPTLYKNILKLVS